MEDPNVLTKPWTIKSTIMLREGTRLQESVCAENNQDPSRFETYKKGGVDFMDDPYNLRRFVDAQDPVYGQVCSELRGGQKTGHWMWFVFPQIQGLGHSSVARKFAISSLDEAQAYLRHSILGPRLVECTKLINEIPDRAIHQILGYPDDLKFRSCMTLFAHATSDNQVFLDALQKYFGAEHDPLTLERL